MTIALGMLCRGGLIIAADTKSTDSNGAVTHEYKVASFVGKNGSFAIANASNDANAAVTMVGKIRTAMEGTAFKQWADLEEVIAYEMTDFSNAFRKAPEHQVIIGASLNGQGVRLYFCEPPNTVLDKTVEGYVSIGSGASVADPLRRSLFRVTLHLDPQLNFRQIAYLMYRAKKEQVFCGGDTTAVYICEDGRSPEWAKTRDFRDAEEVAPHLDRFLEMTAGMFIGQKADLGKAAENLGVSLSQWNTLRDSIFHNDRLQEIVPPT
jgi:20S proteasome alpha/beta subunit